MHGPMNVKFMKSHSQAPYLWRGDRHRYRTTLILSYHICIEIIYRATIAIRSNNKSSDRTCASAVSSSHAWGTVTFFLKNWAPVNRTERFNSCLTNKVMCLHYKAQFMLFRNIHAVYADSRTKCLNTPWLKWRESTC